MTRDNEKWKTRKRDWAKRNNHKINSNKKKYVNRNSDYVNKIKDQSCADCGKNHSYDVMDLDHISQDKVGLISKMAGIPVSLEKLKKEIAKCDVVCVNCHRY